MTGGLPPRLGAQLDRDFFHFFRGRGREEMKNENNLMDWGLARDRPTDPAERDDDAVCGARVGVVWR